jgi:hypothetical protein
MPLCNHEPMNLKRRLQRRPARPTAPPHVAATSPSFLPAYPPRNYLGQLAPEFQESVGRRRGRINPDDIAWYHSFEMPDGRVVEGAWDLRGNEGPYFGGVGLRGKRVLELGPATGYLSLYMERQGAEVVSFETGFDVANELLPVRGRETLGAKVQLMTETVAPNHEAWWYLHHLYGSSVTFVQGNIYDMPADLGTFDVTFAGAILLHLREPWGAMVEAASRTTECMIVTEAVMDREAPLMSNIMRFSPAAEHDLTNWWSIYPGAVVSMFERLGFGDTTVTEHTQKHRLGHVATADYTDIPMYTVVGKRIEPLTGPLL